VHCSKVNSFDKAAKPGVNQKAFTGIYLATVPPGNSAAFVP